MGVVLRWVVLCREWRRVGRYDDDNSNEELWHGEVPCRDQGYRLPLGLPQQRRQYASSHVRWKAWKRRMVTGMERVMVTMTSGGAMTCCDTIGTTASH